MEYLTERVNTLEQRVDIADEARRRELNDIKGAIEGLTKSIGDFAAQLLSQNTRNDIQDMELCEIRKQVRDVIGDMMTRGAVKTTQFGGVGAVVWVLFEVAQKYWGKS